LIETILNLYVKYVGGSRFQEEEDGRSQEVEGNATKGFWKGSLA
jgi:hypothetical protein